MNSNCVLFVLCSHSVQTCSALSLYRCADLPIIPYFENRTEIENTCALYVGQGTFFIRCFAGPYVGKDWGPLPYGTHDSTITVRSRQRVTDFPHKVILQYKYLRTLMLDWIGYGPPPTISPLWFSLRLSLSHPPGLNTVAVLNINHPISVISAENRNPAPKLALPLRPAYVQLSA